MDYDDDELDLLEHELEEHEHMLDDDDDIHTHVHDKEQEEEDLHDVHELQDSDEERGEETEEEGDREGVEDDLYDMMMEGIGIEDADRYGAEMALEGYDFSMELEDD